MEDETGLADRMTSLPKYVASSTLQQATWGEVTIWNGDIVSAAKALKAGRRNRGQSALFRRRACRPAILQVLSALRLQEKCTLTPVFT